MNHSPDMIPLPIEYDGVQQANFDSTIIGAGGAGMCLLLAMHDSGYLKSRKVAVVEPLQKDSNDRTWCFWAKDQDLILRILGPVISASWTHTINTSGKKENLYPYKYYQIRSLDLYQFVKAKLAGQDVNWIRERADLVRPVKHGYQIKAEKSTILAKRVFDSRFSANQISSIKNEPRLIWQSFHGWRIRTEHDCFDKEAFTMMSFNVEQSDATQFLYVLPYGPREALIELTRFSPDLLDPGKAEKILDHWIKEHLGPYAILEYEKGKIPMTQSLGPVKENTQNRSLIQIGTAAGAVKPTTGYAFKRMFDHALSIAAALSGDQPLPAIQTVPKAAFYDKLLIHILKNEPELGKPIFARLFDKIKTPRILRFLDEETNIAEDLPILASLPALPFLRSVFEVYFTGKAIK